jgi:thiol-disulfide isomerase/thioredoxin
VLAGLLPLCSCSTTSAPAPRRVEAPVGSTLAAFAVPKGKYSVYLFVTTDCPIANSYAPWIAQFARELRSAQVDVSLVHVDPDISAEHAQQHARDYQLDLPILLDPDQVLAQAVGATVTPMAAVISARGLEYLGRIDDRWPRRGVDGQVAAHHDLQDAVQALLRGDSVPNPRTEAVGCRLPQRAP